MITLLNTRNKIFIARILSRILLRLRSLLGKNERVTASRGNVRWTLDLKEGIDLAIYLGVYEKETQKILQDLIMPGSTVLDIGANIGFHTLHMAMKVGENGGVIAFEPTQYAYRKLVNNLNLNPGFQCRVVLEQMMLTASDNDDRVESVHSSWPLSKDRDIDPMLCARLMHTTGASAMTLDSYYESNNVSRIDLIK